MCDLQLLMGRDNSQFDAMITTVYEVGSAHNFATLSTLVVVNCVHLQPQYFSNAFTCKVDSYMKSECNLNNRHSYQMK